MMMMNNVWKTFHFSCFFLLLLSALSVCEATAEGSPLKGVFSSGIKGINYKALISRNANANTSANNNHKPVHGNVDTPALTDDPHPTSAKQASASTSISSLPPPEPESLQLRPRVVSLNIMVAGLSGLGKTTTCSALLDSWLHPRSQSDSARHRSKSTSTKVVDASRLFERFDPDANTILRVRIIDTPGFGNQVNHRNSVQPISDYIASCRQRKYKREMSSRNYNYNYRDRDRLQDYVDPTEDELVHVCLYFLSPGRFLEIDRHFMKKVQKQVTIVPIIAKADTLTDEEIAVYRAELREILERERIHVYDFDGVNVNVNGRGHVHVHDDVNVNSSSMHRKYLNSFHRGRKPGETLTIISRDGNYPWGKSRAFDPCHSDLTLIRNVLLSEHTERFLQVASGHYARYRARRIAKRNLGDVVKYAVLLGLIVAQCTGFNFLDLVEDGREGVWWGKDGVILGGSKGIWQWGKGTGGNFVRKLSSILPSASVTSRRRAAAAAAAATSEVATMLVDSVADAVPTDSGSSLATSSEGVWNAFQRLFTL
jgi:cell division control protein 12